MKDDQTTHGVAVEAFEAATEDFFDAGIGRCWTKKTLIRGLGIDWQENSGIEWVNSSTWHLSFKEKQDAHVGQTCFRTRNLVKQITKCENQSNSPFKNSQAVNGTTQSYRRSAVHIAQSPR